MREHKARLPWQFGKLLRLHYESIVKEPLPDRWIEYLNVRACRETAVCLRQSRELIDGIIARQRRPLGVRPNGSDGGCSKRSNEKAGAQSRMASLNRNVRTV